MRSLRNEETSFGQLIEGGARTVLIVLLAFAVLVVLIYQLLAILHRYQLDYGEAPLIDQALRLASGQNLYRADIAAPPYTISNYPPVYVAVLAPFVSLFGPSFWAGRLISAVSAWASALCLGLIIHRGTRDRWAAVVTGLLFLVIPYVTFWSSLARIDLLALAFSLGALWVLVRWPGERWSAITAGLLLVAAIYTRQSYALAAPLAAGVWLLTHNWRRAFGLAALVSGVSAGLFLLLNTLTNGGFFFHIVTANVNEFEMDRLEWNLTRLQEELAILLGVGIVSLGLIRRWNPLYALAAPYLVGAALSALLIGKVGSNVNYFLELCAALALAAGVVIAWSRRHAPTHGLRVALLAALAVQTGGLMQNTFDDYVSDLTQRRALTHELRQLEAQVSDSQGPVLADEYMGLATLQGQPLYLQPFEMTQLAYAGLWDQTPLLDGIQTGEFPLILIYDRPWADERWTPEMFASIERAYVLSAIVAETRIYRPFNLETALAPTEMCASAPWRLPSSAVLGVQRREGGLDFFGRGSAGEAPVYAVADGLLTRRPGWDDAVAIQHDDPLNPGQKVWTYYSDMRDASGGDSYLAGAFTAGASGVPVKAGAVLGRQGTWSGRPNWPMWTHAHFAIIRANAQGAFPDSITSDVRLDPAPYLSLAIEASTQHAQPLKCNQP